jgi:hypothetical protein
LLAFDGTIATRADALKVIKDSSNAFFVLAAIQTALALVVRDYSILFDAGLLVVLSLGLRRLNSRAAAVILLVLAVFECGTTIANRLGMNLGGGNNVILALIMVFVAYRATQATYRLRKLTSEGAAGVPGAPE